MSKERDIEILEFKIAEVDKKIKEFQDHDISNKKIDNQRVLKAKYEAQLAALQA